jgi:integrase
VDKLIEAARKRSRSSERDAAAILLAYRHGLRAAELTSLRWSAIDLTHGRMHVNRAKGGAESVHPLRAIAGVLLGHRNLQSTARYTALAPNRFARFWQD